MTLLVLPSNYFSIIRISAQVTVVYLFEQGEIEEEEKIQDDVCVVYGLILKIRIVKMLQSNN